MTVEYGVVISKDKSPSERQALLNRMGADGWRLVCVDGDGDYVFMREQPAAKTGPSEIKEVRDGS